MIVEFLVLPSGRCPAQEFLASLDKVAVAKVYRLVGFLKQNGSLPFPQARKIQGYRNLWEMRVLARRGQATRVFYAYTGKERISLVSGFLKRSQKTPQRELDRAMGFLKMGGITL